MTVASAISESRSRPIEVTSRLSTWLAAAAPVLSRARSSELWRVAEEADVVLQQLREHLALVLGDDPVADARQRQRADP